MAGREGGHRTCRVTRSALVAVKGCSHGLLQIKQRLLARCVCLPEYPVPLLRLQACVEQFSSCTCVEQLLYTGVFRRIPIWQELNDGRQRCKRFLLEKATGCSGFLLMDGRDLCTKRDRPIGIYDALEHTHEHFQHDQDQWRGK